MSGCGHDECCKYNLCAHPKCCGYRGPLDCATDESGGVR